MAKCQCRWNCAGHYSTYPYSKENPNIESFCTGIASGHFVRFVCPHCQYMRISEVCSTCWERIQLWFQQRATCTCENCHSGSTCEVMWTLYEDVK
jgi:hypothetical protein